MTSKFEVEILSVGADTGLPTAVSYHPSILSRDALYTILINQINADWPLEVHYYSTEEYPNGGVYKTIEANDFIRLRQVLPEMQDVFVSEKVEEIKKLSTTDIIFAEPLVPREK